MSRPAPQRHGPRRGPENNHHPGPGLGGHCIPIDPFYLAWKAREYGVNTRFIELAGEVNRAMPEWVVNKIAQALNERGRPIKGSRILVLGLAYKKNVDDVRESPAARIMELLRERGALLNYFDPHVPGFPRMREHQFELQSVALDAKSLAAQDCVVLVTDHDAFDYELIAKHAKRIEPDIGKVEIERDQDPILGPRGVEHLPIRPAAQPFAQRRFDVVAGFAEQPLGVSREVLIQLEPPGHRGRLRRNGNDALAGQIGRVDDCRRNVFGHQRRILLENARRRLVGGQVVEHDRHGDSRSAQARGAVHDVRIGDDMRLPVHRFVSCLQAPEYTTAHASVPNAACAAGRAAGPPCNHRPHGRLRILPRAPAKARPARLAALARDCENAAVMRLGYLLERAGHEQQAKALDPFTDKAKVKLLDPTSKIDSAGGAGRSR